MESLLSGINRQRERKYIRARALIKDLMRILVEKYHVKKIVLIGSCLNKDRFRFHSDIDLCVKGLEGSLYFKALGELLISANKCRRVQCRPYSYGGCYRKDERVY